MVPCASGADHELDRLRRGESMLLKEGRRVAGQTEGVGGSDETDSGVGKMSADMFLRS